MDSDGSQIICIILLIFLVLVKFFYTACEYADIEVNDSKIKSLAEKDKKYQRLSELIGKPVRMIVSFSMGKTVLNVFIVILAVWLSMFWTDDVKSSLRYLIIALVILSSTVLITALTEILPKKLVGRNPEKFAAATVVPVKVYIAVLSPLSALAYGISAVFCKLFSVPVSSERDAVTEEEIRMMVDAGNETGVLEESQREMINNIFEFGDADISDVMTHRKDICAIEVNSKIGDIVYLAINEGYSRIPVYEETVDNIIGIIYVKDLLCLVGCEHSEDFTVRQFMRKAVYLPETCMCSDAFETLTREKAQCAIVVDEYGGTAGLVSMEDMLEEIVRNIQDEYDDEKAEILNIDEGVYIITGDTNPEYVEKILGIELPERHNYDTMSAFIVDLLGRIPEEDETPSVRYGGVEFTVLLTEDNWISKIKAVYLNEKTREDEG